MTPFIMRQVWALVESMPAAALLDSDDESLILQLVCAFRERYPLNGEELADTADYLRDRLALVRDVAATRYAA